MTGLLCPVKSDGYLGFSVLSPHYIGRVCQGFPCWVWGRYLSVRIPPPHYDTGVCQGYLFCCSLMCFWYLSSINAIPTTVPNTHPRRKIPTSLHSEPRCITTSANIFYFFLFSRYVYILSKGCGRVTTPPPPVVGLVLPTVIPLRLHKGRSHLLLCQSQCLTIRQCPQLVHSYQALRHPQRW